MLILSTHRYLVTLSHLESRFRLLVTGGYHDLLVDSSVYIEINIYIRKNKSSVSTTFHKQLLRSPFSMWSTGLVLLTSFLGFVFEVHKVPPPYMIYGLLVRNYCEKVGLPDGVLTVLPGSISIVPLAGLLCVFSARWCPNCITHPSWIIPCQINRWFPLTLSDSFEIWHTCRNCLETNMCQFFLSRSGEFRDMGM